MEKPPPPAPILVGRDQRRLRRIWIQQISSRRPFSTRKYIESLSVRGEHLPSSQFWIVPAVMRPLHLAAACSRVKPKRLRNCCSRLCFMLRLLLTFPSIPRESIVVNKVFVKKFC